VGILHAVEIDQGPGDRAGGAGGKQAVGRCWSP
jgi:hypothetical protein